MLDLVDIFESTDLDSIYQSTDDLTHDEKTELNNILYK